MAENICILGSTGSIGCSSLEVIQANANLYSVKVLTANKNYQKLFEQCIAFEPELAILGCTQAAIEFEKLVAESGLKINVESGKEAIDNAAKYPEVDTVIAAIVGAAGLVPTLTGVQQGLKVLLANKEALVMSGDIFLQAVKDFGATLLPVDSEHNAIFQSLPAAGKKAETTLTGVEKILLTGSGGPFLTEPLSSLIDKTPDEACAHPNWDMGRKISIDSATMMNKGLEYIEACYLFGLDSEQIQVVIHPQSIIHSMVAYIDGSVIAQLGNPDMKTPIAHCLAWPNRIEAGVKALDFFNLSSLEFSKPNIERFPCLALAMSAMDEGKNAPCTLNAANEVAVDAFLAGEVNFTEIALVIESVLDKSKPQNLVTIEEVINCDQNARKAAKVIIEELKRNRAIQVEESR